jgi:RNA polymerase-binding transcription factor DksA
MSTGLLITTTTIDQKVVTARRKELVAVRASSLAQIQQLQTAAVELVGDGGINDTVDDEGFGEGATLEIERGRVLALASNAANRVDQVDAALRRIDSGSYGMCEHCRVAIDPARLEAMPEATRCVRCASHTALRLR